MSDQPAPSQSKAVEDFLKAIYRLQQESKRVSTNMLAETLLISQPSVTDMAQRLASSGLVDYERYKGVVLTPTGQEIALKVVRRHRLLELYLVNELGYSLDEVHSEAEKLEHAVSERFIEAVAHKLGDPDFDPHGDPIPTAEGVIAQRSELTPLSEWEEHTPGVVSQLKTDNAEMLRHILDRGFKLDSQVEVLTRDPFDGPITARVDGEERVVGHNVASCIFVEEAKPENK